MPKARPEGLATRTRFTALGLDTVEIESGHGTDAQAGAVIARTGVPGHFGVTSNWSRHANDAGGGDKADG